VSAAALGVAPGGRRERVYAAGALALGLGAVSVFAWGGLGKNLVYSWGPAELRAAGAAAQGATVRLGGLVAKGSLVPGPSGEGASFDVTDGEHTVRVVSHGHPPQMLREDIAVVVEGTLRADGVFDGRRLMISHSNEYRAADGTRPQRPGQAGASP